MANLQRFINNCQMIITEFLTSSDTQISVATLDGLVPLVDNDYYIATIFPSGGLNTMEIVKITQVNPQTNVLTVIRGQENTTPQNYLYGSIIGLNVTAGTLDKFESGLDITVNAFGAKGDGVTDDSAAFYLMNSVMGYMKAGRGTYYLGENFLNIVQEKIDLRGSGKAPFNNGVTQAVDGVGTVLLGSVFFRSDYLNVQDLTFDISRFDTLKEGIVLDARENAIGISATVKNVGSIARPDAVTSHSILMEGWDKFTVEDVDLGNHNFGLVLKSRRGFVNNVRGANITTAVVYPKASIPSLGGNVADASVNSVIINNVQGYGGDPTFGCGVWIQAEGVVASRVQVDNVTYVGGTAGVRVSGTNNTAYVIGCQVNNVYATGSSNGALQVDGTTYDIAYNDLSADNPLLGWALSIGPSDGVNNGSTNWNVDGVNLSVTDPTISGTNAAALSGTGQWDNFNVRTAGANMIIAPAFGTQKTGKKSGNVIIQGEGNLTFQFGATAASGEVVPAIRVGTDNTIYFEGVVDVSAASNAAIAIWSTINVGASNVFTCSALTSTNTWTQVDVIVSGTAMTVLSSLTGIKNIYLRNIIVRR